MHKADFDAIMGVLVPVIWWSCVVIIWVVGASKAHRATIYQKRIGSNTGVTEQVLAISLAVIYIILALFDLYSRLPQ